MAAKKKTPKKVANKAKAVKAKAKTAKKTVTAQSKKTPAKKTAKLAPKAKALKVKTKTVKTKSVKAKVIKTTPVKTATKPVAKAKPAMKSVNVKPAVNIDYSKAITPLLDRLVVKVLSGERVTAGGLIIPETASMATGYLKAKVLAIGTGIKTKKGGLKPLDVQVGDTVLFASYAGTKVVFNSEELEIIHESDVMGVVQD